MSDRPRYRSWKKAYGGDPDTAVLHDLHKRMTRVELNHWELLLEVRRLQARFDQFMNLFQPPPPPAPINVATDHGLAEAK